MSQFPAHVGQIFHSVDSLHIYFRAIETLQQDNSLHIETYVLIFHAFILDGLECLVGSATHSCSYASLLDWIHQLYIQRIFEQRYLSSEIFANLYNWERFNVTRDSFAGPPMPRRLPGKPCAIRSWNTIFRKRQDRSAHRSENGQIIKRPTDWKLLQFCMNQSPGQRIWYVL